VNIACIHLRLGIIKRVEIA